VDKSYNFYFTQLLQRAFQVHAAVRNKATNQLFDSASNVMEDVLQQKLVEDEPIDSRGLSCHPVGGVHPPETNVLPSPTGGPLTPPPQGMSTRFVIVARLF